MDEITLWQDRSAAERRLAEQLRIQVEDMWLAAGVARVAVNAVGQILVTGDLRVLMALAADQAVRDSVTPAGERSPLDEAAYLLRTRQYLDTIGRIMEDSSETIVGLAGDLPRRTGSGA